MSDGSDPSLITHHSLLLTPVTLIDRLVHRAEIIDIEGASYRLKEAKERSAAKAAARTRRRAPGAEKRA